VREKFSCRDCEKITQPPAPFHVTPRGFAGPNLLAMILFEKFGQHQPLNRQSERYAREGIDLSVSTLADQVGTCTLLLQPLHELIEAHVLGAERLHGDDTTVPILAKVKTVTGHIWTYVWSAPLRVDRCLECTPAGGQVSGCGFDHLPGMLLFEPDGAPISERGVEPLAVVDLVDEARQ
jgi:Transposase IS66 family